MRAADPKNAGALRGLGLCYLKSKQNAEAASVLKEATDLDPDNADGWAWYGQALALQNQFPASIAALEHALKIKPDHAGAKKLLDIIKKGVPQPAGAKQ